MSSTPQKASVDCGFDDLRPEIEQALEQACEFGIGCPEKLGDAMSYALLAPGKRLRPALVMMAAECCGGTFEDAMPASSGGGNDPCLFAHSRRFTGHGR